MKYPVQLGKYPVLLGALAIGLWSQMAMAQAFDLTLTATDPVFNNPATGAGSFSIDTPPPGTDTTGLYNEGVVGNDLLGLSITLGADTFDLSNELSVSQVQFDASGEVSSISYFGMDNGDVLSINGLDYQEFGVTGAPASVGVISAAVTAVPEPASMGLLAAGLAGLAALRRRRVR